MEFNLIERGIDDYRAYFSLGAVSYDEATKTRSFLGVELIWGHPGNTGTNRGLFFDILYLRLGIM